MENRSGKNKAALRQREKQIGRSHWKMPLNAGGFALKFLLALMLALFAGGVQAGDFYVSVDGDDFAGDGTSGNPWATIQHAIDTVIATAEDPAVIHAGPGHFYGGITFDLNDNYKSLIGAGAEVTIIDAQHNSHAAKVLSARMVRIENLTLTNGEATTGQYAAGAGVFSAAKWTTLKNLNIYNNLAYNHGGIFMGDQEGGEVSGCWVHNNRAERQSGGLGFADSAPLRIHDNLIEENMAEDGGGFHAFLISAAIFERNVVRNNLATRAGGGGRIYASTGRFTRNIITGNSAGDGPAALYITESDPVMDHNIFADNIEGNFGIECYSAFLDGGGFLYNTVAGNASGLRLTTGEPVTAHSVLIQNNIFWNNTDDYRVELGAQPVDFSYNLVENTGGENEGTGVIHGDPLFADPSAGDYHLQPGSPAIDAANPIDDFCLEPEPNGCIANLGSFGNTSDADLSAVITCIPVYTCVPAPSVTPSPEPTGTFVPPSPSATSTPAATNTPAGPTPTPASSLTPTPNWPSPDVQIELQLNRSQFRGGDPFILRVQLFNPGELQSVLLVVALQIYDQFFFYPLWNGAPQWTETTLGPQSLATLTLLQFTMPESAGAGGPFTFHGILLDPVALDILGSISSAAFFLS